MTRQTSSVESFPIVGIGASAGGLEAFSQLLAHLPSDTGMAFVLIQHLHPSHDSELTRLLARVTSVPTIEAAHQMRVAANNVYVIPPNTSMTIVEGVLMLAARAKDPAPHTIDCFLKSLALDQRECAIGVILSGTASDGTLGLEAIKAEGGITFAQDGSARHDSMPRTAIAAGCVDFVLSPEEIAAELIRIAAHPYFFDRDGNDHGGRTGAGEDTEVEADRSNATAHQQDHSPLPSGGSGTPPVDADKARAEAKQARPKRRDRDFARVLTMLHKHCGVDFTLYKSTTIRRRIARRMLLGRHQSLAEYALFLSGAPHELDALYSDVLISVTSFFRNPEAFDTLKAKTYPDLVERLKDGEPFRVWVLGCSTGQEAYSIAMSFVEFSDTVPHAPRLQIFATDLNEALLEKARHGLYAKSLAADITPERLERFFVEEEGGYRVTKALREQVIFARQNLISDPPFSRIDLITCRNLMIYLEPGLQRHLIPTFHYALKTGGYLLLGASESIGTFTELFDAADKKHKIFRRKASAGNVGRLPVWSERSTLPAGPRSLASSRAIQEPGSELNAQREADRVSVNLFAPPGVLINADLQILQFRGATSTYLEPPQGKASFDVLKMAREGLMLPLRAAITKAIQENQIVQKRDVRIGGDHGDAEVTIHVIPMKNLKERCLLVLFEAAGSGRGVVPVAPPRPPPSIGGESGRTEYLEEVLSETRDYLQSVQEQYEAANEELQASNEEVQSANEELQSINEEMETSKEELESTNEELITVNEEMASRNAELHRLNADLNNLQAGLHTAVLLLSRDQSIRRFTAPAERVFNLLAGDVGRPLSSIKHNLIGAPDAPTGIRTGPQRWAAAAEMPPPPFPFETVVREVMNSGVTCETEVRDLHGRWYSLRVHPYVTSERKIDGAVVVVVDIDVLKRREQEAQAARDYAETIVATVRDPLLVLDGELRVHRASDAYRSMFQVSAEEVEGRSFYEICGGVWDQPSLRTMLPQVLSQDTSFNNLEVAADFPAIGRHTMLLNARRLKHDDPRLPLILVSIENVTERFKARAAVNASEIRYRRLFEAAQDGIMMVDPVSRLIIDVNPVTTRLLGRDRAQLIGLDLQQVGFFADAKSVLAMFRTLQKRGFARYDDIRLRSGDDGQIQVEALCNLYEEGDTKIVQCSIRDITERREAEDALRASVNRFRFLAESMPQKIFTADSRGDMDYFNRQWIEFTGLDLERIHGWGWPQFIHPDDADRTLRAWKQSIETGASVQIEHRMRGGDGGYRWHLSRAHAMRDAAGEVLIWIGSSTDIDDVKRVEAELQEADRRKNEFLAMLAHELRNPLAPIQNAVQILSMNTEPETVTSVSAMMGRQIEQLVHLVDDLLDVSRIGRGKIELQKQRMDLAATVRDAVEATRILCERKAHRVIVELPPHPLPMDADPTRVAQIVGNLLINACKFTDTGGHIHLSVETTTASDGAPQAAIRVRDDGVGIAPELLPQIFDMFMQVDTSRERSVGGLGIGLSLVKALVGMHGGTVSVRSDGLGRGSEFIVTLPMARDANTRPVAAEKPSVRRGEPRRVLIADDNADAAESMSQLLTLAGNETRVAHDGVEAVQAAEEFQPELIILDIGMPRLNGYEAARRIREQSWAESVVMIALTGWGQVEDRRLSKEAGFDAHLVKPVSYPVLVKLLDELHPRSRAEPS